MKFRGGGATRKTGSCCDLDLCHSSVKGNLSLKPLKKTCLEASDEKFLRHSELDSESINVDKNRLRLGGRSDESSQITNSSFRHSELVSESLNKSTDSGSESGMTGTESNIIHRKVRSDEGSRMPRTPSRHSDESQSLSMPVNSLWHFWWQKCLKTLRHAAFTNNLHGSTRKPANSLTLRQSRLLSYVSPAIIGHSAIAAKSLCHSELDSESLNKSIDSGSGAGMTKISSNNLCPAGQTNNTSRKAAFTMAEVLITLGIIGIVAAMTLPSLIGRWKDKEYEVRAKRTFSLINQAIERYEAESGMIGDFSALFDTSQTSQAVLKHFSEYFESPTLCLTRSDNCSKYVYYVKYSSPLFDENGNAMADGIGISPPLMVLKDGSIVTVKQFDKCEWNYSGTSYNPDGTVKVDENGNPIIFDWVLHYCASIFFDTNGTSPPNQAGADFFEIRINKDGQFTGWGNSGWTSLQSILSGLGPVYTRYSEGQKKKP